MSTYHTIITNAGKQLFANAINSSNKVNISHLSLGDGNGNMPTPNATRTRLVNERTKVAVNDVKINASNANWLEVSAIIPSNNGGYTVREIGLYAGNTLVAIGNFPATYKPSANEGGAREMSIKVVIALENASVVNVSLDNSLVYATQKWVEQNFVNHNEVVNNLTSTDTTKPLSANMGRSLQGQIDTLDNKKLGKTDNAVSSSKLATPRTITLTGDVSGQTGFDGSANVGIGVTLANTGVQAGTYQSLTVDAKGRVTNGQTVLNSLITATTATGTTNQATGNTNTYLNLVTRTGTSTHSQGSSTKITGTNGISVSSDTAGALTIAGTRATDTAAGVTMLSHNTNGTDRTKAASEFALGEVRRMANQAQVTADGITLTWNNVQNKPTAFTPSTHRHNWSEIDGKPSTYPPSTHAHDWNSITDKPTNLAYLSSNVASATKLQTARTINGVAFDGTQNITITDATKAPVAHRHNWSEIDGKPSTYPPSTHRHNWNDIDGKPSTFAPSTHRHNWGEIDGKPAVINNPTRITSGDLNDYKDAGFYLCESNVEARAIANTASNRAFALQVVQVAGVVQIYYEYESAAIYSRAFYAYTDRWSAWKQLATTDDNAVSATKLQTVRNIAMTGDGSWNVNFDGSQNASATMTLANTGVTAGSYNSVTVDAKGRVTRGLTQTHGLVTATTATGTANTATTNSNTFLNIVASGVGSTNSVGSSTQIIGTNGVSVSSDTQGKLIVTRDSNSPTASKLQTARTINGVAFDGSQDITVFDDTKLGKTENAVSASRLQTARNIALTGAVTGAASFDGSKNLSISTTDDNSIGLVAFFAMNQAPNGWLKANGAAVSRTTYAKLFAKIGTTFGAGDGRTTFNLPDLRGEFIRGFDDGRNVDSGRAFGSQQVDAIRNITGSIKLHEMMSADTADGVFSKTEVTGSKSYRNPSGGNNYTVQFDASTQVPTASENRPRNIALLACIKY